jgi:hypothetical protein
MLLRAEVENQECASSPAIRCAPLIDRNPTDYHTEIEQAAFERSLGPIHTAFTPTVAAMYALCMTASLSSALSTSA